MFTEGVGGWLPKSNKCEQGGSFFTFVSFYFSLLADQCTICSLHDLPQNIDEFSFTH